MIYEVDEMDETSPTVAGEQGFYGPSAAGDYPRIAAWAEKQFWLSIGELPCDGLR